MLYLTNRLGWPPFEPSTFGSRGEHHHLAAGPVAKQSGKMLISHIVSAPRGVKKEDVQLILVAMDTKIVHKYKLSC